jgi:adenylosuccinate synthase
MINGVDKLAITKLDVLDTMEEIKVCVAYEIDGERHEHLPCDSVLLEKVVPIYETIEGWQTPTTEARSFDELPEKAQAYLKYMGELVDSEPAIISVGPKRIQTFTV